MKTIIATVLLALVEVTTHAQLFMPIGGGPVQTGQGTAGIEFTTGSTSLTFQSIGVWDSDLTSPGLYLSHSVGLWDAGTHALIVSAVVPAQGATLIGEFQYVNLATPLTLATNHKYVLGVGYADNDFDFAKALVTSVTTAPGVTLGNPLLSSGTGFEYPDLAVPGAAQGFFGGNLGFAPVPEPSSYAIIASGALLAFVGVRRYRQTRVAFGLP